MSVKRAAAIYARISRDKAGAGLGVERQEADCRALAERLGWEVTAVHVDNDVSAYQRRKPRPGYQALIRDIRDGRVNAVVAWHTDRLNRRIAELESLIELLEDRDVAVATVTAGDLDLSTASGRRTARILASVAQGEVEQTRERIRAAKLQAANAGKWRGGRRPFGYEHDGLTPIPAEAEPLRRAAEAVIAGRSVRSLARELTDQGVTTTTGKPLDQHTLRRLLLRPRNAGLVDRRGEVIGPAEWPAIIPEETWRACAAILTDPSRRTQNGSEVRWLGSHLYRCGECGGPLYASRASSGRRVYRCKRASNHVSRAQDTLDEYVRTVIAGRLRMPDAAGLLTPAAVDRAEPLRAERLTLQERLDNVTSDYADGLITGKQLHAATERINTRLTEIDRALAAVAAADGLAAVAMAPDPGQAFLDATLDRQRAVIDALAVVVVKRARVGRVPGWRPGEPYFDPEAVGIDWREP